MEEIVCFFILFAVEAVIAWLYDMYLFRQRRSSTHLWVSFTAAYLILFFVSRLENTTVNSLSFLALNCLLIWQNYACSIKGALLHSAFLTFIMLMSEVLVALVISTYGYAFSAYTYDRSVRIALIVFSKLLYFVLSIVGARIFSPHKNTTEDPSGMMVFYGLPLISVAFAIAIIHIGMTSGTNAGSTLIMALAVSVLLLVNLLFMVLYNRQQKMAEENMSIQLSLQRDQADRLYYESLQKQYNSQRILIHDIRNHLQVIDAFARHQQTEKISEYILSMDATLRPPEQISLCDHPILNALLLNFQKQCLNENVAFSCDIRAETLQFMDPTSMTALFGNLLSNALEAAAESQERQIELCVRRIHEQNGIVVSVENSCDRPPVANGFGGYISKKKNSACHGIGLKSIERVVKKYAGTQTMHYDPAAHTFHHVIHFGAKCAAEESHTGKL